MQNDLEGKVRKNPASRLFAPLADVYRKNGKIDEAVALLERGLAHHPNYGSARVLLARCREDLGEWDRAREAWLSVLKGDPASLVALRGLGEIAVWTGDRAEAAQWFRRYLEEFPGDERVRERLDEIEVGLTGDVVPGAGDVDPETAGEGGGEAAVEVAGEGAAAVPDASRDLHAEIAGPGENRPGAPGSTAVAEGDRAVRRPGTEESAPGGDTGAPAGKGSDSLETMTLAEIYAQQGFYERALEIYRRIDRQTPGNGRIRDRISALEARLSTPGPEAAPDGGTGGPGAGRNRSPAPPAVADRRGPEAPVMPIPVNVAGSSELESIPGVGPVIARKIVVERERNGPFVDVRDMRRVPSLGGRLIERIEPYLTFDEILRDGDAPAGEPGGVAAAGPGGVGGGRGDPVEEPEAVDPGGDGEVVGQDAEFEEFRRWLKNLRR